uniref:Uncharacterized protein n=1 Tax=Chromera velia CCMP2878 TaxID=1169474 RepID=A0A0G4I6L5_9ALVE|eukprot:Cvel_11428.t1-p1 / transcript=Cvel_11428.t1 / gene=Cvel_11428 / organism=Chromera_velia_CCMP2878 / gene_product=hypothetical protein / transcript_product=hypothetical protein / location=Cvel_scaffold718:41051-46607(+) / protein_length=123 / sequence_SO=supercontig / SO=protein_coding / is_pseudo=false
MCVRTPLFLNWMGLDKLLLGEDVEGEERKENIKGLGFKIEELSLSARGPLFLEDEDEDKDKNGIAGPGFTYETPPYCGEQEEDASEEEFGGEEEDGYSDEEDMSEEEEEGGRRGEGKPRRATV